MKRMAVAFLVFAVINGWLVVLHWVSGHGWLERGDPLATLLFVGSVIGLVAAVITYHEID